MHGIQEGEALLKLQMSRFTDYRCQSKKLTIHVLQRRLCIALHDPEFNTEENQIQENLFLLRASSDRCQAGRDSSWDKCSGHYQHLVAGKRLLT